MMTQDASPSAVVLMPPRPNPGPEPWQAPTDWRVPVAFAVLVALLLAILLRFVRRHRPAILPAAVPEPPQPNEPPANLLEYASAIRKSLARAFGVEWHAFTTEEIQDNPLLRERIDVELRSETLALLWAADRLKFDTRRDPTEIECDSVWQRLDAALRRG